MIADEDSFRIVYDWEPAEGITAPELRETFARVELRVGPDIVTQVEDARVGGSRRSIYVPLYPLAEWIAYNWWFLSDHSRPTRLPSSEWTYSARRRTSGYQRKWLDHHNLRAIGDGFVWPDLTIVPDGGTTALIWRSDKGSDNRTVKFLAQGDARLDSDQLRRVLANLVEVVLGRLNERGLHTTTLSEEWTDLQQIGDGEEADFCRAAAKLGFDPSAVPASIDELIIRASDELPPTLLDDFLEAASPKLIAEDLDWIRESASDIESAHGQAKSPVPSFPSISSPMPGLPWQQGQRGAVEVRGILGLNPVDVFDPERFLTVYHRSAVDSALEALGGTSPSDELVLIHARQRPPRLQRFAAARALWYFATGQPSQFLLTNALGASQKRERAFSAEVLAPVEGIRERLGVGNKNLVVGPTEIALIADHFDVSDLVIRHQIENHLSVQFDSAVDYGL